MLPFRKPQTHKGGDSFCFVSVAQVFLPAMLTALVSLTQLGALSQCMSVKQQLAACGITRKLGATTQWEEIQPL